MKDLKEKKEDTLKYIFGKYGLMAGKLQNIIQNRALVVLSLYETYRSYCMTSSQNE